MTQAHIKHFLHSTTGTYSYVVADPETKRCAIIDSVLDLNYKAGRVCTFFADDILAYVEENGFTVDWILETHAHADHLSAGAHLKAKTGAKVAIGEHIKEVQEVFKGFYHLGDDFPTDGSQFDHLLADGETFQIGSLTATVMHTPGHTPACMTYLVGDAAFVGDTLFMPDSGTARADFPGGSAHDLYHSIQKIYTLPDDTKLYMCHDYKPDLTHPRWMTTVKDEKQKNIYVQEGVTEEMYVSVRKGIDQSLEAPALILPSLQVNIRAGELPPPEDDGCRYLKLPLNKIGVCN